MKPNPEKTNHILPTTLRVIELEEVLWQLVERCNMLCQIYPEETGMWYAMVKEAYEVLGVERPEEA